MKLINKINSMSRKRQTVLYTAIILLFVIVKLFFAEGCYTSPEAVMFACEKGLHYGPSEKVLHVERQERNALVIGKCSDGLSSVPATKKLLFWELGYGGDGTYVEGHIQTDGIEAVYDKRFHAIYGRSMLDDVESVRVVIGEYENGEPKKLAEVLFDEVDSDGFFWDSSEMSYIDTDENMWPEAVEIEGFDKDGNSIYMQSLEGTEIFDSDGELIYSDLDNIRGAE